MERTKRMKPAGLWLCAALAVLGCDAQEDPGYTGETLATLTGEVVSSRASTPPADVVLVWNNTSGSPDTVIVERAPLEGSFPAAFRLELVQPPPPSALMRSETDLSKTVGLAYIAVMKQGKTTEDALLGGAERHVVVYLGSDLSSGDPLSEMFGGVRKKGFHLMRATPSGSQGSLDLPAEGPLEEGQEEGMVEGQWTLQEEPAGFSTPVKLTLPADPADMVFPNVD